MRIGSENVNWKNLELDGKPIEKHNEKLRWNPYEW